MDENARSKELEAKGLQPFYERIVEQLSSLDQKAQAMVSLEGPPPSIDRSFSSAIPNNQPARVATWAAMILLLSSALSSLMVLRIRYGTSMIAKAPSVEEGIRGMRQWRDSKLKFHSAALKLLAAGLLGLVVVLTIILL